MFQLLSILIALLALSNASLYNNKTTSGLYDNEMSLYKMSNINSYNMPDYSFSNMVKLNHKLCNIAHTLPCNSTNSSFYNGTSGTQNIIHNMTKSPVRYNGSYMSQCNNTNSSVYNVSRSYNNPNLGWRNVTNSSFYNATTSYNCTNSSIYNATRFNNGTNLMFNTTNSSIGMCTSMIRMLIQILSSYECCNESFATL